MDLLNKEALQDLARVHTDPCVSLFMPTMRVESELSQNPIRWKNLLRETHQRLKAAGRSETAIDRLLAPARSLLDDSGFWLHQSDGLAGFLTPDDATFYRLPLSFDEFVYTGERFLLKPLFPMVATNNRFYVLALSQNNVRLYQATHYSVSPIHSEDIPKSIHELLIDEVSEQSIQFHTAQRVGGGEHTSVAHGQGRQGKDNRSDPNDEVRRFFQEIDKGVQRVLRDENAPLVLAGVSHYLPIYRQVNSYPHLVDDAVIAGSPDHLQGKELHPKAWELVEPRFLENQAEGLASFEEQHGQQTGLASNDVEDIVAAAHYGRVDTLFVPVGAHTWGRFDAEANVVTLHDERQPGDDELLDYAAIHTFLNGGTVHALKPHNMPGGAQLAALYRYPVESPSAAG